MHPRKKSDIFTPPKHLDCFHFRSAVTPRRNAPHPHHALHPTLPTTPYSPPREELMLLSRHFYGRHSRRSAQGRHSGDAGPQRIDSEVPKSRVASEVKLYLHRLNC